MLRLSAILVICIEMVRGEVDNPGAVRWFRKAAEQGDPNAEANLEWYYEYGLGVKVFVDKNKALEWYKKAAEQGNDFAKKRLKELIG